MQNYLRLKSGFIRVGVRISKTRFYCSSAPAGVRVMNGSNVQARLVEMVRSQREQRSRRVTINTDLTTGKKKFHI